MTLPIQRTALAVPLLAGLAVIPHRAVGDSRLPRACSASSHAAPMRRDQPDTGFVLHELAPGVIAVIRREPPGVINESNALFVIGERDVLVVDAQSSLPRTRAVLQALRTRTDKPVRWLVNTHWHDDHVLGNAVWREAFPNVEVIAHQSATEDRATTGAQFRRSTMATRDGTIGFLRSLVARNTSYLGGPLSDEERLSHLSSAHLLADFGAVPSGFVDAPPTRLVADRLRLHQGPRAIDILFVGRGHTRGDLVVHLPAEGIVATGDLVMHPVQFVGSTSYPHEFAATVDRLRALGAATIVPGHGPVLRGDTHLALISRLLRSLSEQVTAAKARGDSLEQARRRIDLTAVEAEMVGGSVVNRILFSYYVRGEGVKRAFEQSGPTGTAPLP